MKTVIVGAGISGLLAALKISASSSSEGIDGDNGHIELWDEHSQFGGNAVQSTVCVDENGPVANNWSKGLAFVTPDIKAAFCQICPAWEEHFKPVDELFLIRAKDFKGYSFEDYPKEALIFEMGGRALVELWNKAKQEIYSQDNKTKALGRVLPDRTFKPLKKVLQSFASIVGVASIDHVLCGALEARWKDISSGLWLCDGTSLGFAVKSYLEDKVASKLNTCLIRAWRQDGSWVLQNEKESSKFDKVIVAHNPWQAVSWLPEDSTPARIVQISRRGQPISSVSLTDYLGKQDDLPVLSWDCGEKVRIICHSSGEVCFQTTIDYEQSLQSLSVVKSIRKLKRVRNKFFSLYDAEVPKEEMSKVCLVPEAWPISIYSGALRLQKLTEDFNSESLNFVGESYGSAYNGDKNILESLEKVSLT